MSRTSLAVVLFVVVGGGFSARANSIALPGFATPVFQLSETETTTAPAPVFHSQQLTLNATPEVAPQWFTGARDEVVADISLDPDGFAVVSVAPTNEIAGPTWDQLWRAATVIPPSVVPEPGAGALLAVGATILACCRRRRT